jgi:hypothetical protein
MFGLGKLTERQLADKSQIHRHFISPNGLFTDRGVGEKSFTGNEFYLLIH